MNGLTLLVLGLIFFAINLFVCLPKPGRVRDLEESE